MKKILQWLLSIFAWGVPGILTMSGSLPGTPKGSESRRGFSKLSPIDRLKSRLTTAQDELDAIRLDFVEHNLTEADKIAETLVPHTPDVEDLLQWKTQLWESFKQTKKRP